MDKPKYKNLTLKGGGILGIAYCGALEEMHKLGVMSGIKNYSASSAGAIVAGALACGASFNFILQELLAAKFDEFLDYGNKIRLAYNLVQKLGGCTGDKFCEWYSDIIEKLTGDRNITLGKIHKIYGGILYITGTSVDERRAVYFSYKTHADMPLVIAVRISMSLPGIFAPVTYNGEMFVDGGLLDNYPIRCFHKNTSTNDKIQRKTLGLLLLTSEGKYQKVTSMRTYIESLTACLLNQAQEVFMDKQDWDHTIKIPCNDMSPLDFYISADGVKMLIENGRSAVREHFAKNNV